MTSTSQSMTPSVSVGPPPVSFASSLASAVAARLWLAAGQRIRNLQVALDDHGRVVMRGTCRSYYAKQVAQHVLLKLLPDRPMLNLLDVRPDSGMRNSAG